MIKQIAILGIHTGIGKTIASAVIAQAIGADYWKPVQAGTEERDTVRVRDLLENGQSRVYDEAIVLTQPMSPHVAAQIDSVTIDYTKFRFPQTQKVLLIETAGGVLSPMNDEATMADFVKHYNLPAILISQNYLGSINHTLSSIELLRNRNIPLLGVVMNGATNTSSESFIEQYGKTKIIARVPLLKPIAQETVQKCADDIKASLLVHLHHVNH